MMGRIVATVDIHNMASSGLSKNIDVLVDTGARYLTLPRAWKEQFGAFETEETVALHTATQHVVQGLVCGPVRIQVEGFRAIYNEVLFVDMAPDSGEYEPLLGYIVLEQCGVAVDIIGHRLIPVQYMDIKSCPTQGFVTRTGRRCMASVTSSTPAVVSHPLSPCITNSTPRP